MLSTTKEATEYRTKFHSYYYEKIVPALSRYESARKKELSKYSLVVFFAILVGVLGIGYLVYLSNTNPHTWQGGRGSTGDCILKLTIVAVGLIFWWAHTISKNFENKVKEGIMRAFLSFFGNFRWSCKDSILKEEIEQSKLVPNFTSMNSDDYFEGTHRELKVVISEVELIRKCGRDSSTVFDGIFVKFGMNKNFNSHTIITEDNILNKFFKPDPKMQKVELEDPEFNKKFDVYSYDQVESRYILTTSFMERFKHLRETYKTPHIKASFLNNSVTIAMSCNRDMFKLGDLRKQINDTGEFQMLFEEFVAVLSLVELLNLDSKTGL